MTEFVDAVINQVARTENGMKARKSSADACVDLFFKIGAQRGKNIIPEFVAAFVEDHEIALRIMQWSRDIRGGAGEREHFRNVLRYLETHYPNILLGTKLLENVPVIGRWDDLLVFNYDVNVKNKVYTMIKQALEAKNGLCAKWMPRKGSVAVELRTFLGWTPKRYRKTLVTLTNVVEQQMCAKDWDNINFNHVPSVAAARYKAAFYRNTPKFAEYVKNLVEKKEDVKVNASAIYPYEVIKDFISYGYFPGGMKTISPTERDFVCAQWDALPNYVGDASILPMVDVSGSMIARIHGTMLTCLSVAVSLGLYLSQKNQGKFKDMFLTFSSDPELLYLKGDIIQRCEQMAHANWEMGTNLHAAFDKILHVAKYSGVSKHKMPKILLILSDMQFDRCAEFDDSAIEMMKRKYAEAGYDMPKVVFWNLNACDNVPVASNDENVALVSGFSPSIMKSILNGDLERFSAYTIMIDAIGIDKYAL